MIGLYDTAIPMFFSYYFSSSNDLLLNMLACCKLCHRADRVFYIKNKNNLFALVTFSGETGLAIKLKDFAATNKYPKHSRELKYFEWQNLCWHNRRTV